QGLLRAAGRRRRRGLRQPLRRLQPAHHRRGRGARLRAPGLGERRRARDPRRARTLLLRRGEAAVEVDRGGARRRAAQAGRRVAAQPVLVPRRAALRARLVAVARRRQLPSRGAVRPRALRRRGAVKLGPALAHAAAIAAMVALAPAAALADEDADMSVSDCGAPRRLDGIDVSKWQGEIDWRRVHKAGIVFAFVRLADGLDADDRFRENWKATRHAHVRRGAYQYFRASEDGKQQADFALKMLRHAGHADLPLVADVETDDGQPREVVQAELQKWLARVEKRL